MDTENKSPFEPYRTDVLFLLIGTNPLPNYVAACLLATDKATIYLLHTPGQKGTGEVARRLKIRLKEDIPCATIIPREIDEADGRKVEAKLAEIIADLPAGTHAVGLNYSGGTKPMAVHAYNALRKTFREGCFSYLDPRSLKMVIRQGDAPTQMLPVGQAVELGLVELIVLHGYRLDPPRDTPRAPELCKAIAQVHLTQDGFTQWRTWLNTLGDLESDPRLPTAPEFPALVPVIQAFHDICGGRATEEGVAKAIGCKNNCLRSCSKFLWSGWLEDYTLDALRQFAPDRGIKHLGVSIKPKRPGRREFEIDVAAMDGYQLFVISCVVTEDAEKAKEHLLEIFVRARQLGGDEARLGLVCLVKDAVSLQREIEQTWDAEDKIRVFGARHLPHLNRYMQNWFETANKEG